MTSRETSLFNLEDLFFSSTDDRGIIKSVNDVFERISGYSQDELIGAPHKLVRHPDTPRAVFELMWKTIKQRRPIGAYVCNSCKNGDHYWVFAVTIPTEEGYLSVRLKPTSPMLATVQAIYAKVKAHEEQDGVKPQDSLLVLLEHLKTAGFADYEAFMTRALMAEAGLRHQTLHGEPDRMLTLIAQITENIGIIRDSTMAVSEVFTETHQIPFNMRLQAERIEGNDGPISVISNNHRQMTQSMAVAVDRIRDAKGLDVGQLEKASFLATASRLQQEMIHRHSISSGPNASEESGPTVKNLLAQVADHQREARDNIAQLASSVTVFASACKDMRRLMSGLELTRIMCKIERSKVNGPADGLEEIVDRLLIAQKNLEKILVVIEDAVLLILNASESVLAAQSPMAA